MAKGSLMDDKTLIIIDQEELEELKRQFRVATKALEQLTSEFRYFNDALADRTIHEDEADQD